MHPRVSARRGYSTSGLSSEFACKPSPCNENGSSIPLRWSQLLRSKTLVKHQTDPPPYTSLGREIVLVQCFPIPGNTRPKLPPQLKMKHTIPAKTSASTGVSSVQSRTRVGKSGWAAPRLVDQQQRGTRVPLGQASRRCITQTHWPLLPTHLHLHSLKLSRCTILTAPEQVAQPCFP